MPNSFHQRCRLALTHPVTLGAVALLLVNDWLLKPLWQSDWTTGKLSDFAWMVFAPPLLLFALSLLARGNARAERASFLVAYAGLPLLYAAYNTLAPLHDWIMGGFMLLSGASAGSPLDPYDSLVIPPAMAAAVWVWRDTAHSRAGLRARLHLYAVVIAALATVATSYDDSPPNAWAMGVLPSGEVLRNGGRGEGYESPDGGLTWMRGQYIDPDSPSFDGQLASQSIDTPRGTYAIVGVDIHHTTVDGQLRVVHSVKGLAEERNLWAQETSRRALRDDIGQIEEDLERMIVTSPLSLVYHPQTGNVVASMGILGVLVGDADENWTAVAVGEEYVPFDYSFLGRARWLFTPDYWFAAVAVPIAFIAGTFAFSSGRSGPPQAPHVPRQQIDRRTIAIVAAFLLGIPALWIVGGIAPSWLQFLTGVLFALLFSTIWYAIIGLVVAVPFVLFAYARGRGRNGSGRRFIALFFAALGASVATALLEPYGLYIYLFAMFEFFLWAAALVFSLLALFVYQPTRQQIPAVAITFVVMNVVMPLPYFLWLLGGINLASATLGAAALLTLTALALYKRLVRQAAAETPA